MKSSLAQDRLPRHRILRGCCPGKGGRSMFCNCCRGYFGIGVGQIPRFLRSCDRCNDDCGQCDDGCGCCR